MHVCPIYLLNYTYIKTFKIKFVKTVCAQAVEPIWLVRLRFYCIGLMIHNNLQEKHWVNQRTLHDSLETVAPGAYQSKELSWLRVGAESTPNTNPLQ